MYLTTYSFDYQDPQGRIDEGLCPTPIKQYTFDKTTKDETDESKKNRMREEMLKERLENIMHRVEWTPIGTHGKLIPPKLIPKLSKEDEDILLKYTEDTDFTCNSLTSGGDAILKKLNEDAKNNWKLSIKQANPLAVTSPRTGVCCTGNPVNKEEEEAKFKKELINLTLSPIFRKPLPHTCVPHCRF